MNMGSIGANPNLGALSSSQGTVVGLMVGGAILAMYAGGTVVSVLIQDNLLGFDNRMNTKDMVKRAALVGGLFGAIPALFWGSGTYLAVTNEA